MLCVPAPQCLQMCKNSALVDCSSASHVVRIDTRPEAVSRRLSSSALSMLDAPSDPSIPSTPQRFSLPLHNSASEASLTSVGAGGGESRPPEEPPLISSDASVGQ